MLGHGTFAINAHVRRRRGYAALDQVRQQSVLAGHRLETRFFTDSEEHLRAPGKFNPKVRINAPRNEWLEGNDLEPKGMPKRLSLSQGHRSQQRHDLSV